MLFGRAQFTQWKFHFLPFYASPGLINLGAAGAVTNPHNNVRNEQSAVVLGTKTKGLASSTGFTDTNF